MILGIIGLIGIIIGVAGYFSYKKKRKFVVFIPAIVVVGLSFIISLFGITTVKQTEAGVMTRFGEIQKVANQGFNWIDPIEKKITKYDLTTQQVEIEFESYSKDGQQVNTTVAVQYNIDPTKVTDIFTKYGSLETLDKKLEVIIIERSKSAFSELTAMEIVETRGSMSNDILQRINVVQGNYFVTITNVSLTNISFTDTFSNAIEQKMIAEQQQLQAEYERQKAIVEAQKEIDVAELQAQARIAESQGIAEANVIEAQGIAESINKKSIEVARMMGFVILSEEQEDGTIVERIDTTDKSNEQIALISDYIKYLEYLSTWNGVLPEVVADGSQVMITPNNG